MNDESKYRQLVNAITDYAIYMLSPSGEISSWNTGAERFKGYRADEIIGRHFSCFYTREDRASGLPARALATAEREGRFEGEGWRVRKDGTCFWANVVVDPIRSDDGVLIGFAKITRDLTERRHAEEKLRHSQEQFRLLVQGVADYAIYMLDLEGHVASWNAGAERIKGYREQEVLGRHFSTFYTPEDVEQHRPTANLAIARREGRFEGEGWRVRKDGNRFLAHVVIDRIDDHQGRPVGFAKITRDVTDKKQAERAMAVAREALFQSQKSEAIGQLTGGVAHDFNNLLMAVMSSLELMRKWLPDEPRAQALLGNALAGVERGAGLTQRLLSFARRQTLRLEPTDLPALVNHMMQTLQRTIGPGVEVRTRFMLPLPPVLVDSSQLEVALLNLAANGRDAMHDAGGTLEIGAGAEPVEDGHASGLPSGDYVCLWVRDEGEGMDEVTVQRATEPFFSTKGTGKGSGLGLSMAQGLAEQSGGRLLLESRPGAGTTVRMWLPATRYPEIRPVPEATPGIQPADVVTPLEVLVVDDDALVLQGTIALLQELGHHASGASSGNDALAHLARGQRVDLMVTDHAMPGMTGAELALRVRETQPDLPVILASGYAELPDTHARALVRLTKPFAQAELQQAIATAMGTPPPKRKRRVLHPAHRAGRSASAGG